MKGGTLKRLLIGVAGLLAVGWSLGPFLYMTAVSLSGSVDFAAVAAPGGYTLDNYHTILAGKTLHFLDYLRNSILISAASALGAVLIAGLAAYALTRLPLPGTDYILFAVLALSMLPPISIIGYLFRLMTGLGWINTYPALILPYIGWTVPLSLWILVSYFRQVPRELDRAAMVDGCSHWQTLWRVIFPVVLPALFSTAILAFIFAFNEFLFALMLTTDHQARTVPVGIALFQGAHGLTPWGQIMAASVVATLPVVVITLVFQRHIIQGLTRGAVRG